MKKMARSSRCCAVPLSAIFFIVLRLLTHAISNLALQAMEKVRMCRGILRDEAVQNLGDRVDWYDKIIWFHQLG